MKRARWARRLRRFLAGVLALLLAGAVGARCTSTAAARGSPTVLLEAGFRGWSPVWITVQAQVATFTHVCSYDRAGLGLSDVGPRPRTVDAVNADLARVLERASIAPPYVLVGHSAGGMYQRRFLAAHREQIAGLVLVDTDVPTDEEDRRAVATGDDDRATGRVLTALTYTGIFRLLFRTLALRIGPPESERFPEEAKVTEPLGDLPVVIIAALGYREDAKDREDWLARQTSLLRISTRSRIIVREHGTHTLPLVDPDVVTAAIREVVAPR